MAYGRIGVIGAMDSELAALIAALTQPAQETVQGLVFRTGRLGAREVVLVRCGIGKVSAARCTQVLIDRFAPGAVINTGIAGGLASGLAVGDIVVADGLVQHDFDAAPIGFVRGCVCMGDPGSGRRHGRRVVRAVRAARGRCVGRGRFAGARAAGLKAREAAKGSPIRRC